MTIYSYNGASYSFVKDQFSIENFQDKVSDTIDCYEGGEHALGVAKLIAKSAPKLFTLAQQCCLAALNALMALTKALHCFRLNAKCQRSYVEIVRHSMQKWEKQEEFSGKVDAVVTMRLLSDEEFFKQRLRNIHVVGPGTFAALPKESRSKILADSALQDDLIEWVRNNLAIPARDLFFKQLEELGAMESFTAMPDQSKQRILADPKKQDAVIEQIKKQIYTKPS